MKRLKLITGALLFMTSLTAMSGTVVVRNLKYSSDSQKTVEIALERPGSLSEQLKSIPAEDYPRITVFKLSGDMNGLDFAALTKLSNITDLDLSEANLMNGGEFNHVLNSNKLVGLPMLRSLKLPESLLRISEYAIKGFGHLESVTFGSSLEKIEEHGISCGSIKKVYCMKTTPPEFENWSGSLPAGRATLYVPDGCRRTYWMHRYWGKFSSIEQLGESMPAEDYSDVMTIDPECTEIEKNGLHGTYLEIPDSDKPCIIDYEQNTCFTNRKLYVGRTLQTSVAGSYPEDVMEFKTRWKIGDIGLEEVEFGPLATILPYKELDYEYYGYHYSDRYYGMEIEFPFTIKSGGVVKFNNSKIEMPVRKDGEEVGGMFIPSYYSDTQKHEGVNFVISENCVELSGEALSPVHTYIKVEAMNPPELTTQFNVVDRFTKMLIVPDGTKKIYSTTPYWRRFRNIQEASSPEAAVALQGVKADLRLESLEMHIEGGMLYIDGEIPEGAELEVYSADGILLYCGHGKAVEVPAGVLIVRCGSRVGKILR